MNEASVMPAPASAEVTPRIIPRSEHVISRSDVSPNAVKVLYRLHNAGYQAYLVGGGVRDLLLGLKPKDFDVATDARPEEVRALFRNCRLIGRRFRLAHVIFGREVVEVATFRGLGDGGEGERLTEGGRIVRDNVWGEMHEDAFRRDFTVNALYYNIADFSVVDYVGGMEDLAARRLRLIGPPRVRYQEDAVRMLRAVRLAAKLDFTIEEEAARLIPEMAPLLEEIPPARLFEETLKLFMTGHGLRSYEGLKRHGLLGALYPPLVESLAGEHGAPASAEALVRAALESTDRRVAEGRPVTPAFLFAALLWPAVSGLAERYETKGLPPMEALHEAADAVLQRQAGRVALPRRFATVTREIWALQRRLARRSGARAERLLGHRQFRAGYDLLVLRAAAGEPVAELAQWWTDYQQGDEEQRDRLRESVGRDRPRRRRPRRRRRRAAE